MSLLDLLKTSFLNLYRRKARTLLTILGVIIGTMSIVLMIALGEGSAQVFMEQVSQSVDLTKIEVMGGYGGKIPTDTVTLDDDAIASFEALPNVKTVLPVIDVPLYLRSPLYVAELYLQAVPMDKLALLSEKLAWGSISSSNEFNMVLGENLTQQQFRKKRGNKNIWELPVATDIDFTTQKFDVYIGSSYIYTQENQLPDGVIAPRSKKGAVTGVFAATGAELDYQGFFDIKYIKELVKNNKKFAEYLGITGNYNRAQVYVGHMDQVADVLEAIKEMGFSAYSPMEYIKQMQEESKRQQAQWGAVGAIALLVSAIGIINTMLTSIMERKREIGVLKVLGCSFLSLNTMFLIEAALIGFLGGLIGVGFSFGVSALVTDVNIASGFFGSFFGQNVRFVITPVVAIAACVGAALIGMLAGIYPSVRAMRMSAMEALRNE